MQFFTRRLCTPMVLTPSIIKQVHKIAEMDNMPKGLKILNRAGIIIFDSASIAGVDYDEDLFDDDDYTSDDNSEHEPTDSNDSINMDEMDENELADILDAANNEITNDKEDIELENEKEEIELENEEEIELENEEETELENNEKEIVFEHNEEELAQSDNETDEEKSLEADSTPETTTTPHRTTRERIPNRKYRDYYAHLQTKANSEEYSAETAQVIGMVMAHYNDVMDEMSDKEVYTFIQTYSLKQGLKKFGKKGHSAVKKELRQLHDRTVFTPIHAHQLTKLEKQRAMESLLFLTEKRDKSIKARACANGSTQRPYIDKHEAASPTVNAEALITTAVIDAK